MVSINCVKCGRKNELYSDIINRCSICGKVIDINSHAFARDFFDNEINKLFPKIEEANPLLIRNLFILDEIKTNREQMGILNKIRSVVGEIISSVYANMTIIDDKSMERIKDLLFSIYEKKNQGSVVIF